MQNQTTVKILRLPEVLARCGLSRSSVYARLADKASDFPRPVELGPNSRGWVASELDAWLAARMSARRIAGGAAK